MQLLRKVAPCLGSLIHLIDFNFSSHQTAWKPSFADGQFGNFTLLHDSEGRLKCKTSAEPPATFQWFRNGVFISDKVNSRYMLQPDGTLVIRKVDKDQDSVNYTCKAQNMLGEDSATAVPVILGKILKAAAQCKTLLWASYAAIDWAIKQLN